LKSLPETMRPDNYRKIQVNTKSTVIDQIDALEKIYAVVGEAISKRKLMVKGIDAAVGIMDGKPAAKPTPPKKPAATKRKGRPAKNTPPLTKNVEGKKTDNPG
ncbi:MAG: hypothetical protein GY941_19650, partial [Planctomycetes bacterium]|nr:hypothetical protein [Planctomycetota bacterium]